MIIKPGSKSRKYKVTCPNCNVTFIFYSNEVESYQNTKYVKCVNLNCNNKIFMDLWRIIK